MKRREFLALAGGAAVFPRVAFAQQTPIKRLGVLFNLAADDPIAKPRLDAFWAGVGTHGWNQKNLLADYRWLANTSEVAQAPARELVGLKPDLLFSETGPPTLALSQQTQTIPIVFAYVSGTNLSQNPSIESYAHPGGNITGFLVPDTEIYGKYIALLKDLIPGISRVAVMYNPGAAVGGETAFVKGYTDLAAKEGLQLAPFPVRTQTDIADAVRVVAADASMGLIVNGDAYMGSNRATAIAEVAKYHLMAVWSTTPAFTADGGLIGYSTDPIPLVRGAGDYAGLILNGAKPGDLPIQIGQPVLTVNLKAAKQQGITIPPDILARADQVIE